MSGGEDTTGGGSTMTRTTRMIYVEEIADNEKENVEKRFQSIAMETKVTRDTSPKSPRSPETPRKDASGTGSPIEGNIKVSNDEIIEINCKSPKTSVADGKTNEANTMDDIEKLKNERNKSGKIANGVDVEKLNVIAENSLKPEVPPSTNGPPTKRPSEKAPLPVKSMDEKAITAKPMPKMLQRQMASKNVLERQTSDQSVTLNRTQPILEHQGSFGSMTARQDSFSKMGSSDGEDTPSKRSGLNRRQSGMPGSKSKRMTGLMQIKGPKAMQKADELRTIEDSLIYQKLKILFYFMKVAGLFFVRRKKTHHGGLRGFLVNSSPLQWYCIVMIFLLMVNFVRTLWIFDGSEEFGSLLFFKFVVIIFFYEAVSRAILNFIACHKKKNGIGELFMTLENICYPDNIIPYEESLHKNVRNMLILSFMVTAANLAVLAYGFFGPPGIQETFNLYIAPMTPDMEGALVFKFSLFFITFVNNMVAMLSLTFYTLVCYVMHKEFEYFTRTFSMKITPDGAFLDDLERFRIRHQRRCKVVDDADQIFKYYIANTYLTNVPLLCLLLYSVVYVDSKENEFSVRMISVFRMFYVFLQMMILSVVATMISTQVRRYTYRFQISY